MKPLFSKAANVKKVHKKKEKSKFFFVIYNAILTVYVLARIISLALSY